MQRINFVFAMFYALYLLRCGRTIHIPVDEVKQNNAMQRIYSHDTDLRTNNDLDNIISATRLKAPTRESLVKVLVTAEVLNDVFFRVLYFRHVLLGSFKHVEFVIVSSETDSQPLSSQEVHSKVRELLRDSSSNDKIVFMLLRNQAPAFLNTPRAWMHYIGVIVIDDEKYETDMTFATNVAWVYRNYYCKACVSSSTHFIPLGWRTSDGDFHSDHSNMFSSEFLREQRSNPHSSLITGNKLVRCSKRQFRLFFAGQIRAGGRADMKAALMKLHHPDSRGTHVSPDICTNPSELENGVDTTCADVLLSADSFLGDTLDVAKYYKTLEQSRYALVPCGINPESYRLWEALHAGAIPIIELCGSPHQHPLRAMPGALHLFPVIWDWEEQLPTLINRLEADVHGTDDLQQRSLVWFTKYMDVITDKLSQKVEALPSFA
eukprot:m.15360 g.15360  ORF g.15360 m.15360 type:complete len:434 (+) comp10539_c0_seq2:248-1549(+)